MQYTIVGHGESTNVVVVDNDGNMLVADEQHPLFDQILAKVVAGDESVVDDFDASIRAAEKFENLSERVAVANGRVYIDGDELDDVFADQIVDFLDEDVDDWKPLVKFFEKVYTNTEAHTRENLSRWLNGVRGHDGRGITINEEGDIVGYKGVKVLSDGTFGSITHGPAVVDGVAVNGSVPNAPGSVIEMKRSQVQHDPSVGCSVGLHVGTWNYAKGFSQGPVLEVTVNPRDVVSVPTDCGGQKMRVARYKVVQVLDNPYNTAVRPTEDFFDEDDLDGYDDDDYDYDY